MSGNRFEHRPQDFIGVPSPNFVYVGIADRAAFDKIAAPLLDGGENEHGHVLVKSVGEMAGGGGVLVVFQHWIKSLTAEAFIADAKARRAALASGVTP